MAQSVDAIHTIFYTDLHWFEACSGTAPGMDDGFFGIPVLDIDFNPFSFCNFPFGVLECSIGSRCFQFCPSISRFVTQTGNKLLQAFVKWQVNVLCFVFKGSQCVENFLHGRLIHQSNLCFPCLVFQFDEYTLFFIKLWLVCQLWRVFVDSSHLRLIFPGCYWFLLVFYLALLAV